MNRRQRRKRLHRAKVVSGCMTAMLATFAISVCAEVEKVEPVEAHKTEEIVIVVEDQEVEQEVIVEPEEETEGFDWEESYLLCKIAMAEAEGEDVEGKALVMLTVLNRVKSENAYFEDTIKEVIFQKGEFSPIINGRFFRVEPNEECWEALEMVENGWDESEGSLYFEGVTNKPTWHSKNLEKLFTHGNHTFYKEKE